MKMKLLLGILAVTVILPQGVYAQPERATYTITAPGVNRTVILPAAAAHAPVVSLGTAVDPSTGELVEGYAVIHHRKGFAKGGGGSGGGSTCYGYMASGAKWKTIEPWVINTTNGDGLSSEFVFGNMTADIAKWEDATDGTLGNNVGADVLGNGAVTDDVLIADEVAPDAVNEVYFGGISDSGTIGVTIVWGIFSGPPQQRKLSEWDMVFNTGYSWSASGEAGKMDFENIATHELGHAIGMSDLYTSACANETMYGYADNGQTNKRTLEIGDIIGANKLY